MVDSTRKIVEQFVYCLFRGNQMMPILYYLPPSPPCRTVLLLGRLLELDFDLRAINILEGEHLKPEFVQVSETFLMTCVNNIKIIIPAIFSTFKMNPQHCIPTLDDQDLILWERFVY